MRGFVVSLALVVALVGVCAADDFALPPRKFKVNFQKQPSQGVPQCSGFDFVDYGLPFAERSDGYMYGWLAASGDDAKPLDVRRYAWQRWSHSYDCEKNSFIHLQIGHNCRFWQSCYYLPHAKWMMAVKNGMYNVTVTVGDSQSLYSRHSIGVNGVSAITYFRPSWSERFKTETVSVLVTGQRLWLASEYLGFNTKLVSVEVEKIHEDDPHCIPAPSLFPGKTISTLPCEDILVGINYDNKFKKARKGMLDKRGKPIGFTMVVPSKKRGSYYSPKDFEATSDQLYIRARRGFWENNHNNLMNAVAVAAPLPDDDLLIKTTVKLPSTLHGFAEHFCVFLAASEENHVAMCIYKVSKRYLMVYTYEEYDALSIREVQEVELGETREVQLRLLVTPLDNKIAGLFKVTGAAAPAGLEVDADGFTKLAQAVVQPSILSKDAATIDYFVGSSSYAGVFASAGYREHTKHIFELTEFNFDKIQSALADVPAKTDVKFDQWDIALPDMDFPTCVVKGAGNMLYVATAGGWVHAIELNPQATAVVSSQKSQPVGLRLILGIALDPSSTAAKPILWLSHSDVNQENAQANSGVISRVEGPAFGPENSTDRVIGLPRAIFNHATNGIQFGDDGKLYISVGSNTPGGAVSDYSTAFGTRPEQCFTTAILVADVLNDELSTEDFSCHPKQTQESLDLGVAVELCSRCKVEIYASGIRNSFAFIFHSNGHLYATENGVGGNSVVPKEVGPGYTKGDSCNGIVTGDNKERLDPGVRPDLLLDVVKGGYYGFPNPKRDECVFYGGNPTKGKDFAVPVSPVSRGARVFMETDVYAGGVQADPAYKKPMFSFGTSRAPTGIVEYTSDAHCGAMKGDLLVSYYSQQDQVRRLQISADGNKVEHDSPLNGVEHDSANRLSNPLGMATDNDGNLFVAEFKGNKIRVLNPAAMVC